MNGIEYANIMSRKCIQSDATSLVFNDRTQQQSFHVSCLKESDFQPSTPHMSCYHDRLASFEKWPRHIRTKLEEFADAGFFYTGCGDQVRCFYCNGGFHNWKDSDKPWDSHAKWFPNCKYVLQEKGNRYVREIAKQYPNLNRFAPVSPKVTRNQESFSFSAPEEEALNNNLCLHNNDINNNFECVMNSSIVNDNVQSDTSLPTTSQVNYLSTNMNQLSITTQNLDENLNVIKAKLRILKAEQTCKVCLDNVANCLFLPCRHICSCVECAQSLRSCPICRENLEKIIKIYRT